MSRIMGDGHNSLSKVERARFDDLKADIESIDNRIAGADVNIPDVNANRRPGMSKKLAKRAANIQGKPNEAIPPGCMRVWLERAIANGVMPNQGSDRDLNRYFGEKMGFAKPSMESRTLLEDTAGSGQALSPTEYLADVIDVLLPNTLMGRLGFNVIPMQHENTQIPVYTSTYAGPSWIAENGSLSLDAGPAFGPLLLQAPGGWKFYTSVSLELANDAFINGGLDHWLAMAASKKLQVALDTSMLLGVTGNVGVPGLISESGFVTRKQTGDAGTTGLAPTNTAELGVIAELAVKKNIPVSDLAFVSNIGAHEAYERIPLNTYGRYYEDPPLVRDVPWYTSENSALPYVETDATPPVQTGGSYSSLYCGPFARYGYLGIRLDLAASMMRLDQRLIDSGQVGYFSMFRGSVRFAHPETFSRTVGIITV
jgi:HK97 family phage major capsid protein